MKRLNFLFLCLCACFAGAKAWDFAEPNLDGDTIYYNMLDSTNVYLATTTSIPQEGRYEVDTFRIPETVTHNGIIYNVVYYLFQPLGQLCSATKADPKILYIPQTYQPIITGINALSGKVVLLANKENFIGYNVDPEHPYLSSEDGALFNKDKDTLLLFPFPRQGTYQIPNYVRHLSVWSFASTYLDTLYLPDYVDMSFDPQFMLNARKMKSFRFPNSVTHIDEGSTISGDQLEEIIFGSGLTYLGGSGFGWAALKKVICLALTPPQTTITKVGGDNPTLFVPRKSISLYKRAPGWNNFFAIEPIEPPVVSGVNSAEISWVTNAEANSYSLILYLDKEQTRRLMTLTFDERGYLTNMDINIDVIINMPASMPNRVKQVQEEYAEEDTPEFNSYLSFTVTGLTANTKYYYVRKTYNALGEVIDEETGSFKTLSNEMTGLNPCTGFSSDPQKIIKDGSVYILHQEKKYSLDGNCVNR